MTDYALVMSRRHADKQWSINANDYETLTMLDDKPKPTKKSLDDAWLAVQQELQQEIADKQAAAESGCAKLKALGLTDDEIAALTRA